MICFNCVVVEKAVSALSDDNADDISDVKTQSLNPVIVSMLALPLLQIVSLPQPATEHCEAQWTIRDCQTTSKRLLSVASHYAAQHPHPGCHDDASTGSLLMLPTVTSQTCGAYVHLARRLSLYLHSSADNNDDDDDDDNIVNEWLQQVHGSMSANLHSSSLLTSFVASVFLIRDNTTTVDKCLQLLLTICQSDKTQVLRL